VAWLLAHCQYQLVHFSSELVFFSDSKGFRPWCITLGVTGFVSGILSTRKHNVSDEGETEIQLDSFSGTLCFLVFRIPDDG
jgi:hypothetical protein